MACAVGYAFWTGRERARAYFGLMLLLTGAIIGVFASLDLLLFYAFWEGMLIPLYVLVGVWGGPGRLGATLKFVIYTMVGSLLMLAAIIVFGLQQGTFDLISSGHVVQHLDLPRLRRRVRRQGTALPVPRLAAGRLPGVVAGGRRRAVGRGLEGGCVRVPGIAIRKFPGPTADVRTAILVLAAVGLVYGSLIAFRAPDMRGVVAYSSLAQMGLITLGLFAGNSLGFDGAVLQMINHGLISAALFLLAASVMRRTTTDDFAFLGGMAKGRPMLATVLMTTGIIALAVPGSGAFAGEFLILAGVFQTGWLYGVDRRDRDRARRDVHAAADLRGAAPEARRSGHRRRARPAPGRAGRDRPARRLSAGVIGLAGGDQRTLVSDRSFFLSLGGQAAQVSCTEIPTQPRINKCMTLPERRPATQGVMTP